MSTVSVSEARAKLPEIIDRVAAGDEVTITRHGQPVAIVLRPDAVRARRADDTFRQARELREALERARHEPIPTTGLTVEYAEELVKEVREGRDAALMDAFDADVIIYAGTPGHILGQNVEQLFQTRPDDEIPVGLGSLLLLPEVLTKPTRDGDQAGLTRLLALLGRLALRPVDQDIGDLSVVLGAKYRLKTADAIHLATAAQTGADRFITNNRGDFPKSITEVTITYPDDL